MDNDQNLEQNKTVVLFLILKIISIHLSKGIIFLLTYFFSFFAQRYLLLWKVIYISLRNKNIAHVSTYSFGIIIFLQLIILLTPSFNQYFQILVVYLYATTYLTSPSLKCFQYSIIVTFVVRSMVLTQFENYLINRVMFMKFLGVDEWKQYSIIVTFVVRSMVLTQFENYLINRVMFMKFLGVDEWKHDYNAAYYIYLTSLNIHYQSSNGYTDWVLTE